QRRLLAVGEAPPPIADDFDMRHVYAFDSIVDAFKMMLNSKKGVMRVVGPAPMGGDYIEIIVDEPPLRNAMLRYSVDLLLISLLISGITAALVYLALHYLFVRPMRRVTANMTAFRADPGTPIASSCRPAGSTRSALPNASLPPCRPSSLRCCSKK